jgi:hypothetical protein
LILPFLGGGGLPRRDDANLAQVLLYLPERVNHDTQDRVTVEAKRDPTVLILAMLFVVDRYLVRITEDGRRLAESNAMLTKVRAFFDWIPIKLVSHLTSAGQVITLAKQRSSEQNTALSVSMIAYSVVSCKGVGAS